VQSAVVEPVDPFQGGQLDVVQALPRSEPADQLGLVQAVEGLRGRVVVGVRPPVFRSISCESFDSSERTSVSF
jgi:hypothetical protein